MKHYITLTNSELNERISEMIHSERDRKIMRMKLVDGYTYSARCWPSSLKTVWRLTAFAARKQKLRLPHKFIKPAGEIWRVSCCIPCCIMAQNHVFCV